MTMLKSKWTRSLTVAALLVTSGTLAVGCGKQQGGLAKNVQIRTYTQDGDIWGEMIATFETGGLSFPALSLPIFDPKHPGVSYGTVSFRPILSGGTELVIAVNISDVANVQNVITTLPNGTPIPVGGLGMCSTIGLPVGGTKTIVYVALGEGCAMVGVALAIKELDNIGQHVGLPLNFFPAFDFGNGVRGIAGIFTGTTSGSSGIAIFVDFAGALAPRVGLASRAGLMRVDALAVNHLKFVTAKMSKSDERLLKRFMNKASTLKGRASLH
jgi:hypothetical protein